MVGSRCDTVDPMRACRLLITAVRHVVEAHGADGLWQSEMRQQNQNSQNEPGMSFRITETEKRGGEERRLNPHSKLRPVALSHSLPTCYAVIGELRRGRIACIMLQARGLFFKARGIRENSRGTKPADRGAGETRTALTRQGSPGERGAWSQRRKRAKQSQGANSLFVLRAFAALRLCVRLLGSQ